MVVGNVVEETALRIIRALRFDGIVEIEFEVDQNRNGVPWNVTLRRNGALVASTTAVTRAPSGSFEVRRVISNAAGVDRVLAVATSPSGETCSAQASF